jgi:hypothetical protein
MKKPTILILMFFALNTLISKAQWPTWYATTTAEKPLCMIETYDNGYLIAGTIGNDNAYKGYGLLMKTDVNGNILWKKLFGDASSLTQFHNVIQTAGGGMALSGSINSDTALFVKLNPCGEIEWSRVFLNRKNILTTDIIELSDGSFQTMVTNWDLGNPYDSRTLFIKLTDNGNLIQLDSLMQNDFCQPNPLATGIIRTNDNNYLITCATANVGGQSFWIKTSTAFDRIWNICWPDLALTVLGKTTQASDGDFYTSAGSPTGSTFTNAPKIYKFNENGIPVKVFDSLKSQTAGFVSPGAVCMFNDTVLISGFAFETTNFPYEYASYLIVTDTSGNKIQEIPLTNSKNIPVEMIKTYDSKIMVLYQNENSDIAMCKFEKYINSNFYIYYSGLNSQNLTYDTVCNSLITSDTTSLSPIVITGTLVHPAGTGMYNELNIWPNPGSGSVKVQINQRTEKCDRIAVANQAGQEIKSVQLSESNHELIIDIRDLPSGIYFLQFTRKGLVLASSKLVVVR